MNVDLEKALAACALAGLGMVPVNAAAAPEPALVEIATPAAASSAAETTGRVTEFALPSASAAPSGIAAGADGNLWLAQTGANKLARVAPSGEITEFAFAGASLPSAVAAGPDGNMWFAQRGAIGFITPAGAATTYKVDGIISSISPGPDGNLWFTENFRGKIGRATPAGQITMFEIPTRPGGGGSNPHTVTAGPDGHLWFTESNPLANKVGRITTAGVITEFALPTPGFPTGITAGPDGNLWVLQSNRQRAEDRVVRVTPAGSMTEYTLPLPISSQPSTIVSGPDGNLWLTRTNNPANKVARMTPAGAVTDFPVPTAFSGPFGLAVGPDGNLWFTEKGKARIGRLQAAAPNVRYVLHLASGFVPGALVVAQGQTVQWINQMPGMSSVRQAGNPPAFDSAPKGTGSTYAIRFAVAGTLAYADPAHPSHTGTVTVPMTVAPEGGTQTSGFVLTWATGAEGVLSRGWVADVQVAVPGAADFAPWQDGVTTASATYTPTAGAGQYRFRARLRHSTAPSGSGWSPAVAITVR